MDFIFDDLPSSSLSTPQKVQQEFQMPADADGDSSGDKSSSGNITKIQEQHSGSSIDAINKRAQELVEKINQSRTSNQKVIDGFQEKLIEKMEEMCQQMRALMYTVYEENSDEMQMKLQELSEVLENCSKLNSELLEAIQALACLREGLDISQ